MAQVECIVTQGVLPSLAGAITDPARSWTSNINDLNNVVSNVAYDNLYQLTGLTQGTSAVESYTYDAVGNRLSAVGGTSYSYNASNELLGVGPESYTYDDNGNTLTKMDASGTTAYAWDFENRLKSVTPPGGASVTFKYDPLGRRIQKGGSIFVYDGANLIQESDQAGNLVARYIQGPGIDQPLAVYRGAASEFYDADGLGSITSLTTTSGAVNQSYIFDAFGNTSSTTGTFIQPFQYTGREWDAETGLYFYRARYYDPAIGRFLNEDQIGNDHGFNFYTYVGNAPANFIDPAGRERKKKFCCTVTLPNDPDAAILARLIYAEATLGHSIDEDNSNKEMLAIAFSAINRADYLATHPKDRHVFGVHSKASISGVIVPDQYGSVKGSRFRNAKIPSMLGQGNCDFLRRAIDATNKALMNPSADPFNAFGGVFGMRTKGHEGITDDFFTFPSQITGSNNVFYGLDR
ncbi:MAG TPA: RHS repeat-associated core domain-containing protein [Candidatus Saccharimonadales bacterium]|jgi:RHS repeat-associated protein|nr:RHS repeat-associated core domain-containing protein [Candidatus Saccharimonadales bacterium]